MNGESVPRLVEELFAPLRAACDCVFALGVAYGASQLIKCAWRGCWGVRVYWLPAWPGGASRNWTTRFGKWAGKAAAASKVQNLGLGVAACQRIFISFQL